MCTKLGGAKRNQNPRVHYGLPYIGLLFGIATLHYSVLSVYRSIKNSFYIKKKKKNEKAIGC